MYTEERKSGRRQFAAALVLMFALYAAAQLIFTLPIGRAVQLTAILAMYCAAVYAVYVRYTPKYTFTLGEKELEAFADTGRRAESVTVKYKDITELRRGGRGFKMPLSRKVFSTRLLPDKNYCCIIYKGKKALVIEVSDKFYEKLKEHVK